MDTRATVSPSLDYFISRSSADAAIAKEVADILRAAGCSVRYQNEHMPPGTDFIEAMDSFLEICRNLIILLSPDYLESRWCGAEWRSFYAQKIGEDSTRHLGILSVKRVRPPALLKPYVRVSLIGINDPATRRTKILEAAGLPASEQLILDGDGPQSALDSLEGRRIHRSLRDIKLLVDQRLVTGEEASDVRKMLLFRLTEI